MTGFHTVAAPLRSGVSQFSNNLGLILVVFLFGNEVLFLGAALDSLIEHYAHLSGGSALALRIVTGIAVIGAIIVAFRMMSRPRALSEAED